MRIMLWVCMILTFISVLLCQITSPNTTEVHNEVSLHCVDPLLIESHDELSAQYIKPKLIEPLAIVAAIQKNALIMGNEKVNLLFKRVLIFHVHFCSTLAA